MSALGVKADINRFEKLIDLYMNIVRSP